MWEEWLREALTGDRKHRNELEMQKHAALLALPVCRGVGPVLHSNALTQRAVLTAT